MSLSIDGVSDSLVEAVASRAELHARLLGDALTKIFSPEELKSLALSRNQLMDLKATQIKAPLNKDTAKTSPHAPGQLLLLNPRPKCGM